MLRGKLIRSRVMGKFVGGAALVLMAFAILLLAAPKANATPALANGKPCNACHTSSPPTKSNVKD